jgi:hypothetical protein
MPASRKKSPWSESIAPDGTVTTTMRVQKPTLTHGTRVRYVGPAPADGVNTIPKGHMGTLVRYDPMGSVFAKVRWDETPGVEIDRRDFVVNYKLDLEVVTSIPQCERPTRPGMYLLRRGVRIEVATIRDEPEGLYLVSGISGFPLEDLEEDVTWWGPIEAS